MGTKNTFTGVMNDKFNIYSIQPIGEKVNSTVNNNSSFFGLWNTSSNSSSEFNLRQWGPVKTNVLLWDGTNNFLQDGGVFGFNSTSIIFNSYTLGRVNAAYHNIPIMSKMDDAYVWVHELGHSIFRLSDEYPENARPGINVQYIYDKQNIDEIQWKEFLGFRGVGVNYVDNSRALATPTIDCSMKTHINSDFCPVCHHYMFYLMAKTTQQELFYVADPQLTPERDFDWDSPYNSTSNLERMELYSVNIADAQGKKLDFRTVVDNITSNSRRVRLRVSIKDSLGTDVWSDESEEFVINPGELKQLKLLTKIAPTDLANKQYSIIGEVIDLDNNTVIATSMDRKNLYWYTNNDKYYFDRYANSAGKWTYKITINFKNSKTGQPLPNIKPTVIIKRDGETHKFENILFNGYKFDEQKSLSNYPNKEVTIDKKNITVDYYYDELPYKNLKLKLVDSNNQEVQSKTVKVYEGQNFIPKYSDFFMYNLTEFVNNKNNKNWVYSVEPPKNALILNYNDITSNQTELIYTVSTEVPVYDNFAELNILQGERTVPINNGSSISQVLINKFNYDFTANDNNLNIVYNNINFDIPGDYKLIIYFNGYMNDIYKSEKSFREINVKVTPNSSFAGEDKLESEKARLNLINYLWFNEFDNSSGAINDFDAINQNNILSKVQNLSLDSQNFNYEVVDFTKEIPNVTPNAIFYGFKFKIKITLKANNKSVITKEYQRYLSLDGESSDDTINEILSEINRINNLNLKLQKEIWTQEEINNINQQNLLDNILNWVTTQGFTYQVVDFKNIDSNFHFKIRVLKNGLSRDSNEFKLAYQIDNTAPVDPNQKLLDDEISRINSLNLILTQNTFTQEEINGINQSNLHNYISEWTQVINSSNFQHEIINFNNLNNNFSFNIKVTKGSLFATSKQFNLGYSINEIIDNSLNEEKDRVDQLPITWNSNLDNLTEEEFGNLINNQNNDKILEYLSNWEPNSSKFTYDFSLTPINELVNNKQTVLLTISISNQSGDKVTSTKELVVSINTNNTNSIESNDESNLPIILSATIIPSAAAIAAGTGFIVYKTKRRRY